MGRLITESGTSLAIVAANNFEVTYFPFNVGAESITIDTRVDAGSITSNTLSANSIVGEWAGLPLQSYQVNVEGIDIKATGVPPNRYLKTNEQGIVAWVEESKSSLNDIDDLDVNNNLTVKGYISAQGNLSANDIDAQSNILSAGVNLLDIFTTAGGSVAGCGTANKVTKWTNSTTVGDSNISDNGDTVTIASSISSGNLLNITNDGDSKFCVAYDGSTTIQGNLSVHGDMHYIDTNVTVTSALSIINSGTGPALYVEQKGTEPIAHFIDKEGDDIIFDDNGRIGLGLFSPEQKLTVAGGISASEGLSAGRTSFFAGNVGIGTTTPQVRLQLENSDGTDEFLRFSDTAAGGVAAVRAYQQYYLGNNTTRVGYFGFTADEAFDMATTTSNGRIRFMAGANQEAVRITSAGNVGIGTTNPGDKLTVAGGISASGGLSASNACIDGNISVGDNDKIKFGVGSDLEIYSDGTNGRIDADPLLQIAGNTIDVVDGSASSYLFRGIAAGAFEGYHSGVKKFETTAAGAKVIGGLSASGGLSANNLDSAYNILSAGTDLVDIFAPASGGGYIDGSGTANTIAKFSDSNTITDSCITDNGTIVTVSAPVSSDDYVKGSKFCLGSNSRVDNPATNNLGLFANNDLGLEIVSDTRVCSHLDLTVNGTISASSNLSAGGRFFAPNGAQASPTFSFSDFPGTGLFMADTDTLGFSTKGCRRVVIDESGNVGIGDANPSYPLHICQPGAATLAIQSNGNDDEGSKLRLIEGSANWLGGYVQYDGADNNFILGVHNVNNTTLSDDNPVITIPRETGNVGIGVTNPGVTLTVQGGISASGGLSAGNLDLVGGSGTTNFLPKFTDPDTLGDSIAYVGSDNINIEGGLSALQGLSADNNIYGGGCVNHFVNNVGINIANPSEKLTIQGALSSSNKGVFHKIGLGTNGPDLRLEIDVDAADDGILITANNGARKAVEILAESASNGGGDVKLYGGVNNVCGRFRFGNDSFLSGTDFGLGTSSPGAPFHIKSTTSNTKMRLTNDNSTNWDFTVGNTGYYQGNLFISNPAIANEQFTLGSTGNVGINVFNPTEKLTVGGNISACGRLCINDIYTNKIYDCSAPGSYYLDPGATTRINVLCMAGYACMSEIRPYPTLSVKGGISAQSGLSANNLDSAFNILSAGTDLTDIFGPGGSAGNVNGSGTACFLPVWSDTDTIENSIACQSTGLLTINGSISSKGYCSDVNNNTFLGTNALDNSQSQTCNTAIGCGALECNATGHTNVAVGARAIGTGDDGCYNVAVGEGSLCKVTGNDNVAIGRSAMRNNTSGTQNTAVGRLALLSNTTSSNNVGIGYAAGCATTTGCCNTSIGSMPLRFNTIGSNNIALGYQSLYCTLTASNNVAIGSRALMCTTTGTQNVGIGKSSLCVNTEGSCNTAIGYLAMNHNTTGVENTAIGRIALCKNTTGERNIAIGGRAMIGNTTGCCNVGIGVLATRCQTSGCFNVGIGTCALFANLTSNNNTAIGSFALKCNTTGTQNTAIGRNSGCANTEGTQNTSVGANSFVCNTTGSFNANLGYNAGFFNTTGNYNTGIGYNANQDVTEADYNTAVGFYANRNTCTGNCNTALGGYALNTNTTGGNNVAIGMMALCANESASNNVAVGKFALRNNTTANGNVAVGQSALCANTTATGNTAVGCEALKANTDQINNTAIGLQVLTSNTTGSSNTGLGAQALLANTSGYQNTAVGEGSLTNNTCGLRNTAIGYRSGYCMTSGDYNVALGCGALHDTSTANCNTAVGNAALLLNTAGCNTGVGTKAACANTSGFRNVAVGHESLKANTIGCYNVALGERTLQAAVTASENTAVGASAGFCNTTGCKTTAIGFQSLFKNSEGTVNTAVGANSLVCNTTGLGNTAVGTSSLGCNCTTDYSTAVGYLSLRCSTGARNVGIGVSAGCRNSGSCNTFVGYEAGRFNCEAVRVTALGYQALGSACNCGCNNTAVGALALRSNTTGTGNQAFGYQTLECNTTGCINIAVGYLALLNNVSGNYNIGIGSSAGSGNCTGHCNTSIGTNAGRANESGGCNVSIGPLAARCGNGVCQNIAIGTCSLFLNASGSDNLMMGHLAGYATNAHNNIGIGTGALQCNDSGTQNVVIGRCAAQQNTTGGYNTVLGGSAFKNNTTGGFNVAIGNVALLCNTNASNNVAIGYGAAYNNTTASGTVAIGFYANYNNCTGIFNTTLGAQAMQCNTGACNTALGYCALHNNSTSTRNTAVGMKAGVCNTTGGSNTIVGSEAMLLNATGNYNTALGQAALYANTCASCNVAVGGLALRFNTEGNYHTAVGTSALYCNTTSTWNTAVGFCAGYEITTGSQNTLLGPYAGHKTATGQQNTYLGYAAGRCNVSSNNVAIGHNAARCQNDGSTALTCAMSGIYIGDSVKGCQGEINSIAIGYGACSCGSNTVNIGNSETTHTYLNGNVTFNCSLSTNCTGVFSALSAEDSSKCNYFAGNVGIGAKSPSTILEVSGTGAGAAGIDLSQGEGSTISNRLFFSTGTPSQGIALYNLAGTLNFSTGAQPANTSGDSRMYLTNGGNLGIGASSPSDRLTVQGDISGSGDICLVDNGIIKLGTGNDLQLQHDGANSYISENGTGDLWLTSNNASIYLQDSNSGRTMLAAKGGSGEKVELYHSGSKKFETMSDGASVFGDLSASGNGYFDCVIAGGYFEEKAANDELAEYETGSLVVLGQDGELEISTRRNDRKVFGVTQKGSRQPIVLGAEPVLVTGKIRVGDFISTSDKPGHGQRMGDTFHGAVIAQAMESGEGDSFLIKAMIRKM